MGPNSVLSKTQKGAREIETRENKLDHRLRALLIMVNGKATAAELAKKFEQIGDIAPLLQQLAAQGFVEEAGGGAAAASGTEHVREAQIAICTKLRDALGPDGDVITEKIEACKSFAEIRTYLESKRAMLDQWLGKVKGPHFWAAVDAALR
jgi:hypothetical protein